ncbi:Virulence protein RhuM family protein [Fibrobacter sp. UWH9]|uniref:RhuM family protein n=2 Tax=Fibrobacter TaxID=832 RepID=UPI000912055A|nr:RhuM family protein [Fibrobacter sp. UWH9]SHG30920.1 Virulence protein RhuM family protein [Fibrobacter sp. UWH9]
MENQLEKAPEKGEIIAYHTDGELHLDVRLENETVWLTQAQMAELFGSSKQNISLHINNIFKEGELDAKVVVKDFLTATKHGAVKGKIQYHRTKNYNLDVIISVGYRVKSIQGTRFRQWANKVLKDHLLKGFSINQRLLIAEERIDHHLANHENRITDLKSEQEDHSARIKALENQVDFFVKGPKPPEGRILPANSRWDGFALIAELIKSAEKSVVFIDPFADVTALNFAAFRKPKVTAIVYTARITTALQNQVEIHNKQYPGLQLRSMRQVHDRFLLVDDKVYHFGASFKDMGNGLCGYSIMDFATVEQVMEMVGNP